MNPNINITHSWIGIFYGVRDMLQGMFSYPPNIWARGI